MGLLDKVKAQAATVTDVAKEAAAKGQTKLDELQQKRAADALLRELGLYVFRAQTGELTKDASDLEINRLVTLLKEHVEEHGPLET
jgi:hypothetical protein